MALIIVRYAEVGLKGRKRPYFEKLLVQNIRRTLGLEPGQVRRDPARVQIVVEVDPSAVEEAKQKLAWVFGVAWFAHAKTCESNLDEITRQGVKLAQREIREQDTFGVRARRWDKSLPFNSQEVEKVLGTQICKAVGARANLGHPDKEVYVYAGDEKTFLTTEKIAGRGGLPVGSSGKVLSLISGGFDSVASSFQLAKRGASVDFLHFHVFPNAERVLDSKMPRIWNKLTKHTLSKKVFLASDFPFQTSILHFDRRQAKYELVVFRRLMVSVAEKLAEEYGYQALVLGDSLGQVASQTMENIRAVDQVVNIPLFRPLIGTDKREVIDLVRQIGLEAEVNERYQDCCSILASHPTTSPNLDKLAQVEAEIRVGEIVEHIVQGTEVVKIDAGVWPFSR